MNIQTKMHGENQVVISAEDLQKLVKIAEKIEPIEITEEITVKEAETKEKTFAEKLLAEGFISNIPARDENDEDDDFELVEFQGELLSEQIIRERR